MSAELSTASESDSEKRAFRFVSLLFSRPRFLVSTSARALGHGTGTAKSNLAFSTRWNISVNRLSGLTLSQLLTFDSIIRETFTKFSYQNRPSCVGEFSKPVLSRNRKKTSLVS